MSTSTPKKPFVPARFSKSGSASSDVFSKKYSYENTFKTVYGTSNATFEASIISAPSVAADGVTKTRNVRGYIKDTYRHGPYTFEGEVHTDANRESKYVIKRPCLFVKGLNWTFTHSTVDGELKSKNDPYGALTLEGEYTRDHLYATALVKSNGTRHLVKPSLAVGFDGVSVGGAATVDVSAQALTDYNLGAQYAASNGYTAAFFTKNKAENVTLSLFKSQGSNQQAAQLSTDLSLKKPVLSVGLQQSLDNSTVFKAKADVQVLSRDVEVAATLEHRLASPQAAIAVSASVKPDFRAFAPQTVSNFGASFTFGDY